MNPGKLLPRLGVAVLVLAAMMGADGGCQRQGSQADLAVVAQVTEGTGPYHVEVRTNDVGSPLGQYHREDVPGGKFQYIVHYKPGDHKEVRINVRGHRSDVFRCYIEGPNDKGGKHFVFHRAAGGCFQVFTTP